MQHKRKFGGKKGIIKDAQMLLYIVASLSFSLSPEDTTDRCTIIIASATCVSV